MATDPLQNLPPLPADGNLQPDPGVPAPPATEEKKEDKELNPTPFFNYVVIGFIFIFGVAILAMIIIAVVSSL
ncbi:MAG: hypothetical protein TR69_WS6001001421 [candidate division WS6 bacterium OLB20]|uniref:Uncharacterized protein n=1 Tax=candidate division WS6 bacterium OLB20 TaxID=1617426 RepID=A0A136LVZ5_9BACT|nr:MAG: hypothetical protein TR69_WS6001001421 [candidate division WS6 bacterium OLB20]